MIAHIWLGLLTAPLVILHHGLSFEWGGSLTFWLMLLFWGVIISGLVGLYLQQVLPSYMLNALPAESIVSQIPHLSRQMVDDAERMLSRATGTTIGNTAEVQEADEPGESHVVVGAVRSLGHVQGKVLETQALKVTQVERRDVAKLVTAFEDRVRPYLLSDAKSNGSLRNPTQAATYFSGLRSSVSGEATKVVDSLEELCETRRQFDQQAGVHRLLHGWMIVHLPLSVALMVVLAAHIVSAIRYAGVWPI